MEAHVEGRSVKKVREIAARCGPNERRTSKVVEMNFLNFNVSRSMHMCFLLHWGHLEIK